MLSSRDYIDRQKLSIQEKLDKACVKDAKLWVEELTLMEKTSRLHEKRRAFHSLELHLHKQLGVLSEKEKEIFAQELASIEDLERSEQRDPGGIEPLDTVEVLEPERVSFNSLFDFFSPLVLASFVNISQSFGPPLG